MWLVIRLFGVLEVPHQYDARWMKVNLFNSTNSFIHHSIVHVI